MFGTAAERLLCTKFDGRDRSECRGGNASGMRSERKEMLLAEEDKHTHTVLFWHGYECECFHPESR